MGTRIDLHIHSSASDGRMRPGEIFEEAQKRGLRLVSITDHDTVDAQEEAAAEARRRGLLYLTGVELNVSFARPGYTDGKAVSTIVLAAAPSRAAREGAAVLGDHLAQISGARPETVAESVLGEARVDAGRIVFAGTAPATTVYILVGHGRLAAQLGASCSGDVGKDLRRGQIRNLIFDR